MYEIKRFDFTPILGWSNTRYDIFISCKRQYYYQYYSKYDPVYKKWQIDSLKQMTSIPMEIGSIVHDVIETLLNRLKKTEEKINEDRFYEYALRKTQEYCRKKEFSELFYMEIDRVDEDEIYDDVKTCLDNFLNSERFTWLSEEAISNKASWIIEPAGYGETRIDGMKAYCKVDFLFPIDDKIYIMDWKTGKKVFEKHSKQLKGYSAWASYHFSKSPNDVIPTIAYLRPKYEENEIVYNEFDLEEFSNQVQNETKEMYSFCKDINENIPEDKEKFVKTPNKLYCDYCNYRKLCN